MRWYTLSALVLLLAIGFIDVLMSIVRNGKRIDFLAEYLQHFQKLIAASGFNSDEYVWLTTRVAKAQIELGESGVAHHFRPPFENYVLSNYQLLVNTLPEIRTGIAHPGMAAACEDAFLRRLGVLQEKDTLLRQALRNPLDWLRRGVSFVISLPIRLVVWSGLANYSLVERTTEHPIFRVVSFLVLLVGLLSSIITITLGWSQFSTWGRSF